MSATTTPLRRLAVRGTGRPLSRCPVRPPTPTLRDLGPGDGDVLDAVFAGLSPRSRLLRFHGSTPRLTAGTRRHLAAVDGRDHIAVAALSPAGAPIGIARLVRLGAREAELAIEVVDAWQGLGVGRLLLHAVVERGRAAGVERLVAEVLRENRAMRTLLASVLPIVSLESDGDELRIVAALLPTATTRPDPLAALAA